jgi:hypothetical protein
MHPQLLDIAGQFRAAQARLHALAGRLAPEQWTRRPEPARWSVAECVEHLNLTGRAYIPLLESALDQARVLGAPAPRRYRRDPIGWLLWRTMPPPVRHRTKTVPAMVPNADRPPAELLAEFDRLQAAQLGLTEAADGLPIQRVRIPSPFGPVKYNAFSALTILPVHQERHIWQAEQAAG